MKHIKTINRDTHTKSAPDGGCGECRTSCQSACKTSCTVANQKCEQPRAGQSSVWASVKQSAGRPLS